MPRQPDPELEGRILKAAQGLWKRGGEKALTLRAVAEAAGSNTPAVYRRFKNRQEIVRALLRGLQAEVGERQQRCRSVEEMAEDYLEWALSHRHEFELFYANVRELSPRQGSGRAHALRESKPNLGLLEKRLAERLGGSPEDHTRLALALWASAHGTITLLLTGGIPEDHAGEMRCAFRAMVRALIRGASAEFSNKSNQLSFVENSRP